MSEAKSKVLQIIDENPVSEFTHSSLQSSTQHLYTADQVNFLTAVFSKSSCSYCTNSKDLLRGLGAKFHVVELDKIDDGSAMQAALKEINGQSTVPSIYIQKKHIGGNSHLQAMKSKLHTLLAEAGAL
ncbi:Glutaredoxin [Golovinomyces cichoracearum]|uniref:Glutaredoxin n=1 Tax=Golovinomyces cichoracearum TaxID=62708 RepID=A0A420HGJ8_9PEZI|nr:Glutaredoxin [Golovinomyces cichoracearum]